MHLVFLVASIRLTQPCEYTVKTIRIFTEKVRKICMRVMSGRAATNFFWQLISNVRETEIFHMFVTLLSKNAFPRTTCLMYVKSDISVVFRRSVFLK